MALSHTILTLLAHQAYSGYDLSKEFDESVSCYWHATSQQIYRELSKLEEQALIAAEVIHQEGRPDKKLYSLTETGRLYLVDWVAQQAEPTPIREDLLVKLQASYLLDSEVILTELWRRRKVHADRLSLYDQQQQHYFPNPEALGCREKCAYLTLKRGIRYEAEWIAWCDEAIATLMGTCE